MALLLPLHQAALNLFSFHDLILSDAEASLFTSLKILDPTAVFSCIWHDVQQTGHSWHHQRCRRLLTRIDSLQICDAFKEFHFYAGDPLMHDDDEILQRHLTLFIRHFLCAEHHFTSWDLLRPLMLEFRKIMCVWRRQHLVPQTVKETHAEEGPKDQIKTNDNRLSRLFKISKKAVGETINRTSVYQMRERSQSPRRDHERRHLRKSASLSSGSSGERNARSRNDLGKKSVAIVGLVNNVKERMEID